MKEEVISIRLGEERLKAVNELAKLLNSTRAEAIRRMIDTAIKTDSCKPVVLNSSISNVEQLGLFRGEVASLCQLWRDVRSRVNIPRPVDPRDKEGLEHWRQQRELADNFFKQSASVLEYVKRFETALSGLDEHQLDELRSLKKRLGRYKTSYENSLQQEEDPKRQSTFERMIVELGACIEWLERLGISDVR